MGKDERVEEPAERKARLRAGLKTRIRALKSWFHDRHLKQTAKKRQSPQAEHHGVELSFPNGHLIQTDKTGQTLKAERHQMRPRREDLQKAVNAGDISRVKIVSTAAQKAAVVDKLAEEFCILKIAYERPEEECVRAIPQTRKTPVLTAEMLWRFMNRT